MRDNRNKEDLQFSDSCYSKLTFTNNFIPIIGKKKIHLQRIVSKYFSESLSRQKWNT